MQDLLVRCDSASQDHPAMQEARTFLKALYKGVVGGFAQLSYCKGDPRIEKLTVDNWYQWPQQANLVVQQISWLAEQYGDVYVSQSLHSQKRRQYATALPSCAIWIDDVPASDDYSISVETSEGNRQAIYILTHPIDVSERRELQRSARSYLGGDPASADAIKPIRIPGTFNTKRHGKFLVRLDQTTGLTYSVDELAARWPKVFSGKESVITPLCHPDVERKYGNIEVLLSRAEKQLPRMARNELTGGGTAPSPSEARYRIVYGLVSVGFPDDEIAALLYYWHEEGLLSWGQKAGKGVEVQTQDIERCIAGSRQDLAEKRANAGKPPVIVSETRGANELPAKSLRKPKARQDRPQKINEHIYFTWLREQASCGAVLMTRTQIAAEFGVSESTIRRLEKELGKDGLITRDQHGRHGSILRVVNIAAEPVAAENETLRVVNIAVVNTLKNGRFQHQEEQTSKGSDSRNTPPLSALISQGETDREADYPEKLTPVIAAVAQPQGGVLLQEEPVPQPLTQAEEDAQNKTIFEQWAIEGLQQIAVKRNRTKEQIQMENNEVITGLRSLFEASDRDELLDEQSDLMRQPEVISVHKPFEIVKPKTKLGKAYDYPPGYAHGMIARLKAQRDARQAA